MSQALRTTPAPRVAAEIERAEPYRQQPMRYDDIERLALNIARSGLFGIKTPDQAMALMMIAQAEGRHPALAARDYDVIQGRPAKKAEAMMRDFMEGGGKIEWHALNDQLADATFSHPQGGTVRIAWDMKRAAAAQLATKDNWKKFPRQMLRSRTVSEGVRTVWPMATSGMMDTGEAQDAEPFRGTTIDQEPAAPTDDPSPTQPPPATTQTNGNGNGHKRTLRMVLDAIKMAVRDAGTEEDLDNLARTDDYRKVMASAPEAARKEITDAVTARLIDIRQDMAEQLGESGWAPDTQIENDPTLGGVVPDELATPPTTSALAAADLIAQIKAARDPRAVERVMSGMIATALLDRFGRERPELAASIREAAAARTAELRAGG
jgi:hypothetical protein